eukprot:CAMPEP_0178443488 /NCGR_PEP_ID=MMETSP0689_2-20121128/38929_1 /TAXON_ID=160604 /ORGANISM="Amphidinium massartii, Strain CS-259" /LENGTH=105 /DNA_ID=CAMNT_0020067513 /DNA_START=17 /DNA_END=334 /DNA_ORIENTATION=-
MSMEFVADSKLEAVLQDAEVNQIAAGLQALCEVLCLQAPKHSKGSRGGGGISKAGLSSSGEGPAVRWKPDATHALSVDWQAYAAIAHSVQGTTPWRFTSAPDAKR